MDLDRPSVLFAGESIMVGHGLTWDESVPGQAPALLGIQSANLSVEGFATTRSTFAWRQSCLDFAGP